jgi:hypothetical protein
MRNTLYRVWVVLVLVLVVCVVVRTHFGYFAGARGS